VGQVPYVVVSGKEVRGRGACLEHAPEPGIIRFVPGAAWISIMDI
jgi:hypothetical protein